MLNIVIYEDNKNYMQKNVNTINVALSDYDIDYRIHKFMSYTNELDAIINDKENRKIYILDVEMADISGLEVASKIREVDWDSIIIFATAFEKYKNDVFYTRLMVLDFVCKYHGYEDRLKDDIIMAISIIDKNRMLVFSYNHSIYRIPFDQICYIEKELIIKRCIIHTFNNDFYVSGTLNGLMEKLDGNFVRTHQSCIVNFDNVQKVDMPSNTIVFNDNLKTNMLTDKMKREVKQYVGLR